MLKTPEAIVARIDEFLREHVKGRRAYHFSVKPRYSAGSGALVDEQTAVKVAFDEVRDYQTALDGVYGTDWKERAEKEGLTGISMLMFERKKHWLVLDLCTGETYEKPFAK